MMSPLTKLSRRRFMTSSIALGGLAAVPGVAKAVGATTGVAKKLNIAVIGIGNQGTWHLKQLQTIENAHLVALCEVDSTLLAKAAQIYPDARTAEDFREVLKWPEVEAVLIATPDHSHAVISAAAMRAGKHVYCEKPLTHTVREARAIADLAGSAGVVTQMGIQVHNWGNYSNVVKLIRDGTIGAVSEVHVWHGRVPRPAAMTVVEPPATLNYDLWLGPIPHQPFRKDFHPYNWHRYWDFGTGSIGNFGCHFLDLPFWTLDLKYPTRVEAVAGEPHDDVINPEWIIANYDFPARGDRAPVKLTWYDAPQKPAQLADWKVPEQLRRDGVVFIGEDGKMLFANYHTHHLLPAEYFSDFQPAPAEEKSHHREWIDACLAGDPSQTSAPFSYAGPLTESALLGNVAFRAQQALEWDSANLRVSNSSNANALLSVKYREGWSI